jgi:cell division cycle 20-like protein 1 (cofactor of APC complex)
MDPPYTLQVSTHGNMQHQVAIWEYPGLAQLANLAGPTSGASYMAMSPDGEEIVTSGGGEILCLWKLFTRSHSQTVSAQFIHFETIFFKLITFFKMTYL